MKNVGIPYILYKKDHRDKQKTERSGVLMLMSMVFNLRIPRCRQLALQALYLTLIPYDKQLALQALYLN